MNLRIVFFDLTYCNKGIFIGFKRGVWIFQVTSGGGGKWSGSHNTVSGEYNCFILFIFCFGGVALLCCRFEILVPGRFLPGQGGIEMITSV